MDTLADIGIEEEASRGNAKAQILLARRLAAQGRGEDAVKWLSRAAAAGDVEAKCALGRHLLTREPRNIAEGLKWTALAANEGSGEAARFMAVLTGSGLGMKHSLEGALAHLKRAAEYGHRTAQAELAALAGEGGAVDVAAWLNFPKPRVISPAPRIAVAEGFIAPAICARLIELGKPHLQQAQTFDPETGNLRYESARSNSAAQIMIGDLDMILVFVRARIAALTGLPLAGFEDSMILHYAVGQEFLPHFDFLDVTFPGYAKDVASHGQRVVTFLIYLNEGFEGGETAFPELGRAYKGRKGDAVFFWNVTPDGAADKRTLHAGTPPTQGEKWLFSQWIRFRAS